MTHSKLKDTWVALAAERRVGHLMPVWQGRLCAHGLIRLTSFRQCAQQRLMKGLRCFDLGGVAKFGELDQPGIRNHPDGAARELRIVPKSRSDIRGTRLEPGAVRSASPISNNVLTLICSNS